MSALPPTVAPKTIRTRAVGFKHLTCLPHVVRHPEWDMFLVPGRANQLGRGLDVGSLTARGAYLLDGCVKRPEPRVEHFWRTDELAVVHKPFVAKAVVITHGVSHVTARVAEWKDSLHGTVGLPLFGAAVEVEGRAVGQDGGSRHLLLPCDAWGNYFKMLLHATPDGVPFDGVEEVAHVKVRYHHRCDDARLGSFLHGRPPMRQRFCATGQRHAVLPHAYQGGQERLLVLSQGALCRGGAQDFAHLDGAGSPFCFCR